jgi:hypothetical protein
MKELRSKSVTITDVANAVNKLTDETQKIETFPTDSSAIFILFDLACKTCRSLTLTEILTTSTIFSRKPCILYLKVDKKETIEQLFQVYKFNPLIQTECCEWSFKEKDYVMYFENCFFISISDCSINEDIENPIQVKMLVYPDFMIVITFEKAYFIENLFKNDLNFSNFPQFIDPDEGLYLITGNRDLETQEVRSSKSISLEDGSFIEIYLHKILESMISRYEKILFALLIECQTCMCYSTEISYKERVEYLVRVSVSEKSLIYFSQLIKPKLEIMKSLKVLAKSKKQLRIYIRCLKGRIGKMNQLNFTGKQLLKQAKVLYRTCCDDKLTTSQFSSGNLAKFYSGLTALFLPPALMTGLWGTNFKLPIGDEVRLDTFYCMFSVLVFYFIVGVVYLKKNGWI